MRPENEQDGSRVFGEVAETYHRLRPRYPDALVQRIVDAVGNADQGVDALELGAGTGIATRAMLDRGFRVTAVEPDARLAAVLARNLGAGPGVRIENVRFEDWTIPPAAFDLVYSATAFHWLDPATRIARVARALRPGGHLAIFGYQHVAGGDEAFFERIQQCYLAHMPGADPADVLRHADDIPVGVDSLDEDGYFAEPQVWRWTVVIQSTRDEYLDLLTTYSGHRWLDAARRDALLRCIGDEIDALPGGIVHKAYLFELVMARRTEVAVAESGG